MLDALVNASWLERSRAIQEGLPASILRELVSRPPLTLADLARVVAPRRTLDRRLKEDAKLTLEEGERLTRFAALLKLCEHIFGSREDALDWLESPKTRFDGERPIDLIRDEAGARAVEELLVQAQHGMLA